MVLLPRSKQAVVVLINANSELPFNDVNAVMSRLPIGIVNLLAGQLAPQGPSLREAYRAFNSGSALAVALSIALAWWASRSRRSWAPLVPATMVAALICGMYAAGMTTTMLAAFAPDLALVLAIVATLLCLPVAARIGRWVLRLAA